MLYFMSYAVQGKLLGAAFVEADGPIAAHKRAEDDGYAPAGRDVGTLCFDWADIDGAPEIPAGARNRLLTPREMIEVWPDGADLKWEDHFGD